LAGVYFAINGKSSHGTVLLFELHPPLSTYNVDLVFLLARWM